MDQPNDPPAYRSLNHNNAAVRSHSANDVPPDYIAIFADPQEDLPPDAQPTRHQYTASSGGLLSKSKKSWLTLDLTTRPTTQPQWLKTPRYFGGDSITGVVGLNLDSAQSITSIVLVLKGRIITSFEDLGCYVFLQNVHTIWKKADGDPRSSANASASTSAGFNGKFVGEYKFNFSFPFPTEIDFAQAPGYFKSVSARRGSDGSILAHSIFATPQTFLERNLPINIEYELALQVHHGMLRFDTKIKTPIVFIPEITPEPLSLMRAEAYRQAALIPSPLSDPEGWHASTAVTVRGILQSGATIDVEYTLYLATPLSYTRGTVIPCYLSVVCNDSEILRDLSVTKTKQVRLMRTVNFFAIPLKEIERHLKKKEPSFRKEVDEVDIAVWWQPLKDVAQEATCTIMEGEIHLLKELVPSSDFLPFRIEYSVELLPPNTAKFQYHSVGSGSSGADLTTTDDTAISSSAQPTVLICQPITIATFNASGPRPTPFTERRRNVALKRQVGFESENLANHYAPTYKGS